MTMIRLLALPIFALVAGSALAQPKPALVQDRDEPGRSPYVQTSSGPGAPNEVCNGFSCTFTFAAVPAGKRLVVTYVSIAVILTDGSMRSRAFLYRTDNQSLALPVAQRGLANQYVVSAPVTFFVDAGSIPTLEFQGSDIDPQQSRSAALIGYLISLP